MTQVPLNLAGLLIVVVYLPASVPPASATDDNASAATSEAAIASCFICAAASKAPPRGTILLIVSSFVVWSLSEGSAGPSVHLESGDHAHRRVEYAAVVGEEAAEDVVPWCKAGEREPARPVRTDHARSAQRLREDGGRAPLPATAEPADEAGRGLASAEPVDRPVVRNRIAVCEAVDARPAKMRREHETEAPVDD